VRDEDVRVGEDVELRLGAGGLDAGGQRAEIGRLTLPLAMTIRCSGTSASTAAR
jgi:hypothetical protein